MKANTHIEAHFIVSVATEQDSEISIDNEVVDKKSGTVEELCQIFNNQETVGQYLLDSGAGEILNGEDIGQFLSPRSHTPGLLTSGKMYQLGDITGATDDSLKTFMLSILII